ncbi:MAG: NAD-dependent epimerase/dehydratase family protein [Cetobacterium sp.]
MNKILNTDFEYVYRKLDLKEISGKTFLISGISGFIGSYIAKFLLYLNDYNLLEKKIKIIGIARNKNKCLDIFQNYEERDDIFFKYQDISQKILLDDNIDYILHAASQASPKYYKVDPVGTMNANILGTINLLELAKEKNIESFLFFSSSEVYGNINDEILKENKIGNLDIGDIRNCYAISKRVGEVYCRSYFKQYNIPTKVIRIFHTYGPGLCIGDGRVFMDFIEDVINERNIQIKSSGEAKRAFCYIADAVIGYLKVLLTGTNGEAYNVGNSYQEVSVLELANRIANIFPEKKIKVLVKERNKDDKYLMSTIDRVYPSIEKIKTELNWVPEITIEEGFARTIKYIKENK